MFNKNDTKKGSRDAQHAGARTRGVTLVETLVAFAIVSVTFVIVLDAFLTASRATQAAERRAAVADALSYALADMAREAQVSGNFQVTPSNERWSMERNKMVGINAGTIEYRITTTILKCVNGSVCVSLLPDDVTLTSGAVTMHALPPGSPARVFVKLAGYHLDEAPGGGFQQPVFVQTQFTEREK